ncbi:MAG: PIN domain-containing protein [Ardenticatenales bacterium]|nr:PIN domain-containing protein [Ardenticatenales bacterium]
MPTSRESVIVDTSAWVAFLRDDARHQDTADLVEDLIEAQTAVFVGPVIAELAQGARGARELHTIEGLIGLLPYEEATVDDWRETGEVVRGLRARGITLPFPDTMIAVLAKRRGLPVLTLDRHFVHLPVRQLPHDS